MEMEFALRNFYTKPGTLSPPSPPRVKRGPGNPEDTAHVDGVLHIRVDMPGCSNDDLTFWVEGFTVHFSAAAPPNPARGFPGKLYGGSKVINPAFYKIDEAAAEITDGVFWLAIPMHVHALDRTPSFDSDSE